MAEDDTNGKTPDEKASKQPRQMPWVMFKDYVVSSVLFYKNNPGAIKSELTSGITISILKVPESVAFSYVAGVHPLQGLYGSFWMGIITGVFGGRPGMISGCAGALAVVIKVIMEDTGPFGDKCPEERREYLFFTMFLTGVLQILCACANCAVLVVLIPKTAFLGFFNGLAVVIFMSQLDTFRKPPVASVALVGNATSANLCAATDFGFQGDREWYGLDESTTWLMLVLVAIVMATMELLPKLPDIPAGKCGKITPHRILPPSLVGLMLAMAVEWCIFRPAGLSTPLVKDQSRIKGGLPPFHIPDVPWGEWETWSTCLPVAAALCAIGLVESVLTLQAVDQILDENTPLFKKNQECLAQGVANLTSGFFMAMGGDAMIGQSTINVLNGAKGRLSACTDAIFLMLYIILLDPFIEAVPTASLAGILFIVVIHTFNWPSVAIILRRALPLYMCFTIVIVTILSVATNLAVGVGVGIIWECVCYVWEQRKQLQVMAVTVSSEKKIYRVAGDVFFANSDDLNYGFTPTEDPQSVVCDLANGRLLDYSALFTLNAIGRRYVLAKKQFAVEMKEEDYVRYMAVCDEDLETPDCLRKLLPTRAAESIQGKVSMCEMTHFKFQDFKDGTLVKSTADLGRRENSKTSEEFSSGMLVQVDGPRNHVELGYVYGHSQAPPDPADEHRFGQERVVLTEAMM